MNGLQPSTDWVVLTGRPCSGITTTLAALARQGFRTVHEAARSLIDERMAEGQTVEQIRANDVGFQRDVLKRKVDTERGLPTDEVILLDRALPDSIVYHAIAGLDPREVEVFCKPATYRKVFFMEPLPYAQDYARTESGSILDRLGKELPEVYRNLAYDVIRVPVGTIEERVDLILKQLDQGTTR